MRGDCALQISTIVGPMLRLTVPGDAVAVRKAMQDLAGSTLFASLSEELQQNAEIVLAEVMNNIVEHAYAKHSGHIILVLAQQPMGLFCQITDNGAPMPGLSLPQGKHQPLNLIADLPEGGFGWFLIRSLTDDLTYRHENGVNHLSFQLHG